MKNVEVKRIPNYLEKYLTLSIRISEQKRKNAWNQDKLGHSRSS